MAAECFQRGGRGSSLGGGKFSCTAKSGCHSILLLRAPFFLTPSLAHLRFVATLLATSDGSLTVDDVVSV